LKIVSVYLIPIINIYIYNIDYDIVNVNVIERNWVIDYDIVNNLI